MTVDEIYLKIANNIVDTIKSQWCVAIMTCEYDDGAAHFKCVYKEDNDSDVDYDFDVSYETFKAIERLHKITTEGGENAWNRVIFTLYPTGKFDVNFEWDQAYADEIESFR